MGMDISFMAISQNEQQLEDLSAYIKELYDRDYENDLEHRMCGYANTLEIVGDFYVLKGEFRKCFGSDLGYWCALEQKNDLLRGVLFLEDEQDSSEVFIVSGKESADSGLLANYEVAYDVGFGDEAVTPVGLTVPWELWKCIVQYFGGRVECSTSI